MAEAKTKEQITQIISKIKFRDEWFCLMEKGDGYLLQLCYLEKDIDGKADDGLIEQHARKWYISPYATASEIVRTAFLACMVSAEHRVREHFTYEGKRLFGPHIDIDYLMSISPEAFEDSRD